MTWSFSFVTLNIQFRPEYPISRFPMEWKDQIRIEAFLHPIGTFKFLNWKSWPSQSGWVEYSSVWLDSLVGPLATSWLVVVSLNLSTREKHPLFLFFLSSMVPCHWHKAKKVLPCEKKIETSYIPKELLDFSKPHWRQIHVVFVRWLLTNSFSNERARMATEKHLCLSMHCSLRNCFASLVLFHLLFALRLAVVTTFLGVNKKLLGAPN